MDHPIRLLLADDQPLMVSALTTILNTQSDLDVVVTAHNGFEVLAAANQWKIDVAILDIQMPQMTGLEAAKKLLKNYEDIKILILTTFNAEEFIEGALDAGVHGFLLKDVDPGVLIDSIRRIYNGASVLSPEITHFVMQEFRSRNTKQHAVSKADKELFDSLTMREKEIIVQIAEAKTNAEIAESLSISTATVKTYISRLITKLDMRDRVGLAVWVHRNPLFKL